MSQTIDPQTKLQKQHADLKRDANSAPPKTLEPVGGPKSVVGLDIWIYLYLQYTLCKFYDKYIFQEILVGA